MKSEKSSAPSASSAVDSSPGPATFALVPLDQLRPSKTNPRRAHDKKKLDELAASINEKGILEPLLVRPIGVIVPAGTRDGQALDKVPLLFEIVAGERRYKAAKIAELPTAPCLIRAYSDDEALEIQVIENDQREDVHPLDQALGYRRILDHHPERPVADRMKDLATKLGRSESFIYQRLKLAELIPAAQRAFLDESISAGHAILIARLQPPEQKQALEVATDDMERCSVRDLAQWIEREVHLDLDSAAFPKDDAALFPKAGACTECPKRTGFAPALFPDVKKRDTCTDPQCFHAKQDAFIKLQVREAKASGEELLEVNGDSDLARLFQSKPAKCENAVPAIIIEGRNTGQVLHVCHEEKCRQHGAAARRQAGQESRASSDPGRTSRLARERKRRREMARRDRIFAALAAAKIPRLEGDDLAAVAAFAEERLWQDAEKRFLEALGIAVPVRTNYGSKYRDYGAAMTAYRKQLSAAGELPKFLLLCALAPDLLVGDYRASDKDLLFSLARRHGVNVAALSRALAAEFDKKNKKGKSQPHRTAKKKVSSRPTAGSGGTSGASSKAKSSAVKKTGKRKKAA